MLTDPSADSLDPQPPASLDSEADQPEQPMLAEILSNKCTASVNALKEQFWGLIQKVSLLWPDLQRKRERTTVVESRISDMEDKLPPLTRDTQPTSWKRTLITGRKTWRTVTASIIFVQWACPNVLKVGTPPPPWRDGFWGYLAFLMVERAHTSLPASARGHIQAHTSPASPLLDSTINSSPISFLC